MAAAAAAATAIPGPRCRRRPRASAGALATAAIVATAAMVRTSFFIGITFLSMTPSGVDLTERGGRFHEPTLRGMADSNMCAESHSCATLPNACDDACDRDLPAALANAQADFTSRQ